MSLKIKNNERFLMCLKYIDKNDFVSDIGCDHGYLGIQAITEKEAKFVQFIDNKKEPLNQALENLNKTNINSNQYELSLSSGLNNLNNNTNKIVIMGMGGELISEIIDDDLNKITPNMTLILEANSKIDFLREYLFKHDFDIIDEDIVLENNKFYEFIIVRKSTNNNTYNIKDIMFGPILLQKHNDLFIQKWNKVLLKYKDINKNNVTSVELQNKIKLIEDMLCQK